MLLQGLERYGSVVKGIEEVMGSNPSSHMLLTTVCNFKI